MAWEKKKYVRGLFVLYNIFWIEHQQSLAMIIFLELITIKNQFCFDSLCNLLKFELSTKELYRAPSRLQGGPWPTLHPQHCIQVIFQSEGNASGGPGPALHPQHCIQVLFQSEGNASGGPGCGAGPGPPYSRVQDGPWPTLHPRNSAYKCYFKVRAMRVVGQGPPCSLLVGGPWSTLQQVAGRALAHHASATLHTSAISEWGQCEWWVRARPAACWRILTGAPTISTWDSSAGAILSHATR